MAFLASIGKEKVKLKKTETVVKSVAEVTGVDGPKSVVPKLKVKSHEEWLDEELGWLLRKKDDQSKEEKKAHDEWVATYDIEAWYPMIKDITFKTSFVPMSIEEARALVSLHLAYKEFKSGDSASTAAPDDAERKEADDVEDTNIAWLTAQTELMAQLGDLLKKMADGLSELDKECGAKVGRLFVKLSSRSPKDSLMEEIVKLFEATVSDPSSEFSTALKAQLDDGSMKKRSVPNALAAHLLQCQIDAMELVVLTADGVSGDELLKDKWQLEALMRIVKSKRCYEDLEIAIALAEMTESEKLNQHLILREWQPMLAKNEYRAFVCRNRLTAICQYNHLCQFKSIGESSKEIVGQLSEFWIKSCAPILTGKFDKNDYIIDFVMLGDDSKPDIKVVEVNPFETDTDALLFRWFSDASLLCGVLYPESLPDGDGKAEVLETLAFRSQGLDFCESDAWKLMEPLKSTYEAKCQEITIGILK